MKKVILFILGCVLSFALLRLISRANKDNYYNSWSNKIVCTDHCLHEIGHKLDDLSGWVSKTPEWRNAVPEKDLLIFKKLPLSSRLFVITKGDQYTEMYAIYLERYSANFEIMPYGLREFYNQELLNQIMSEEKEK